MVDQGKVASAVQNEDARKAVKKPVNPRKTVKVLDGETELYRHFDSDGDLLYVGISLSTVSRLMNHREVSSWFGDIARIEIQRFPTRHDARDAEIRAIRDEGPIHNRSGKLPLSEEVLEFERLMAELTPAEIKWIGDC